MISEEEILSISGELGFDLTGFAKAELLNEERKKLEDWLERGYQAGMDYMEKNLDKKEDVTKILPSAKSVISLGLNYYHKEDYENLPGRGKVSRYAWGTDYHYIIWNKTEIFIERIKLLDPGFEAVAYVDTGPVMDKVWAAKAGLGWMGKNTNIINRGKGSWFFIANIICNREFTPSAGVPDYCGSCSACVDACPTGALDKYILDSSKCISYLTIENKGETGEEFRGKFENWLFGCDICQDVCPWNVKFSEQTNEPGFLLNLTKEIKFDEIKKMSNSLFKKRFAASPLARARLKGLKRNALFLENEQD